MTLPRRGRQQQQQQQMRGLFFGTIVVIAMVALLSNILIFRDHFRLLASGKQSPVAKALRTSSSSSGSSVFLKQKQHQQLEEGEEDRSSRSSRSEEKRDNQQRQQEPKHQPQQQEDEDLNYPVEDPIPNPAPKSGYDSFSACLLIMDDNHRLIEWLAYHYHVLPLRYLIVAVDPRSRTSPTFILNRYRRMGMYIEEWTDHEFLDSKLANNIITDEARFQLKRDRHRARQKVFYRTCLIQMEAANRTYVTLHDTDEYLVYNHAGGNNFEDWERLQQQNHDASRNTKDKERMKPFHTPPTTAEEGSMLAYIRREKKSGHPFYQSPCVSCPRLHFGAIESTEEEVNRAVPKSGGADTPAIFDPERFDTLQWRKHSKRNDFIKNNLAKVFIDVSQVNMTTIPRFRSLHRPIPTICQAPWVNDWESGLRINHYLGSWESFSFRNDARRGGERSLETWEFQRSDQDETDDNIRPWLDGFVQTHGQDTAQKLLQGVGLPKSYRNKNESSWRSMWLDAILSSNQTEGTNPKNHEFDAFVRKKYLNTTSR